ncbi:Receptor-like protein 15 [Citrus sinensis]|uniref:Receptor-like protein 15 n=1 Tax=Citrus sinensis TaxID=2711 RepID=A0ACB8I3Y3_CITSI|nr:Receptor-like protein 15 [Citrus sinensis]
MLVFFLLTIILEGCWGTEGCLEQERSALLRLKHDFFNDPFNLENWVDDENHSDCCKWEGVECNTSTGRVKALYLSSKRQFLYSTAGQLNASLLTPFQQLETLHLDSNNIAGFVENGERLSGLSKLKLLNLGRNLFNNSIFSSLAGLSSLRTLSLGYNRLKGSIDVKELDSLSNLNVLDMGMNEIEDFSVRPKDYSSLRRLHALVLDDVTIRDGSKFFQAMGSFPSLKTLSLQFSNFTGTVNSQAFTSLKRLSIQNGRVDGALGDDEEENSLHGQLFSKKNYLRKLARLHLDANYFTGEIPKSLSNCSRLEGLYMSDNNLYGNIPARLGNLSSLNDIMMASNHLQGPIPLEFCQLNYLEILDLSENNISGSLPSCSSHSTIQQVHLSKNMLYGPLKYGTFFNRSSIVTLDLSYNSFSGNIPYWIERLIRLRYLILANNNLEGEVPNQLCGLKQLRLIDLSNNNLFGQIPGCLDNTSLHNNGDNVGSSAPTFNPNRRTTYFVGPSILEKEESIMFTTKEISFSYKGKPLNKMYGVDLSCNKLTGEIPPQIGKLTNIRALNFSHNNLTGVIPVSFSNLNQVESLDVSHNNLNGKIPPQLVELNALVVFSVAHNNLSGKIPEWTAQFTTFKEDSYEGNPLLCGKPLPDCDVAAVPEASNEQDGNSLIDMGSFYITFTSSYAIVILAIIGVLCVNPHWRRRWFYLIENWMTSCFYFIVDNLIPTRFYRAFRDLTSVVVMDRDLTGVVMTDRDLGA